MSTRRHKVSRLESRFPQPDLRQLRNIMEELFDISNGPNRPEEFYKVYANRDNLETLDSDWARQIVSMPGAKELFWEMVELAEKLSTTTGDRIDEI